MNDLLSKTLKPPEWFRISKYVSCHMTVGECDVCNFLRLSFVVKFRSLAHANVFINVASNRLLTVHFCEASIV